MRIIYKKFIGTMLFFIALSFSISGCGSNYDKGYDDGWEESKDGILYSFSKSYKQGYEDGADDAYYFDLGCNDANNGDSPQYPNNVEYMQGYDECY